MDGLHGGDDAELSEAGDVRGRQVLGMLDAEADVLLVRMGFDRLLEDIEHLAVGPVADGVDAELIAVFDGDAGRFPEIGDRIGVQPGRRRQVRIGLQEPGPVGAQGAVDEPLDGMDAQMVGAVADQPEGGRVLGHPGVRFAQHDIEPDAQLPLIDGLFIELHLGPADPGVRDAGQSFRQTLLVGQLDDLELLGLFILGRARRLPSGQGGVQKALGGFQEGPDRPARGVLDDFAAARVWRLFRNPRHLHGLGVG